jgi:hypothetical protein
MHNQQDQEVQEYTQLHFISPKQPTSPALPLPRCSPLLLADPVGGAQVLRIQLLNGSLYTYAAHDTQHTGRHMTRGAQVQQM